MDHSVLFAALCLVLVIEGLFLLAAPGAWKRMATQLLTTSEMALRVGGALMVVAGLVALQLLRSH